LKAIGLEVRTWQKDRGKKKSFDAPEEKTRSLHKGKIEVVELGVVCPRSRRVIHEPGLGAGRSVCQNPACLGNRQFAELATSSTSISGRIVVPNGRRFPKAEFLVRAKCGGRFPPGAGTPWGRWANYFISIGLRRCSVRPKQQKAESFPDGWGARVEDNRTPRSGQESTAAPHTSCKRLRRWADSKIVKPRGICIRAAGRGLSKIIPKITTKC